MVKPFFQKKDRVNTREGVGVIEKFTITPLQNILYCVYLLSDGSEHWFKEKELFKYNF